MFNMSQKSYFTKNAIKNIIDETLLYVNDKYNINIDKQDLINHLLQKNIINQSIFDHMIQKPKETCHALVKKKNRCNNLVCKDSIYCIFHTINKPILTYEQYVNINNIKNTI